MKKTAKPKKVEKKSPSSKQKEAPKVDKYMRAARYRQRHLEEGLCVICPKPRVTKNHCREHADHVAYRQRMIYRKKFGLPETDEPLTERKPRTAAPKKAGKKAGKA